MLGKGPNFPHPAFLTAFSATDRYNRSTPFENRSVGGITMATKERAGGGCSAFPGGTRLTSPGGPFRPGGGGGWDSSWAPCWPGRRSLALCPFGVAAVAAAGRASVGSAPWRGPAWATCAWRD